MGGKEQPVWIDGHPPNLATRAWWWISTWVMWWLRDRWTLKREGFTKGKDGWWTP